MLKALINGTSLIGYYPTTCELVEIKNGPNPPEAKPGFDYIEQVKKLDDGTYTTEWTAIVSLWNKKMEKTNMKNRGAVISSRYGNNFHIIRESACSAVLLEHFFFTNLFCVSSFCILRVRLHLSCFY